MKLPTCPDCGGHQFDFIVTQLVTVEFTPACDEGDEEDIDHEVTDGPRGDMEWDENTEAFCCHSDCGWSGLLGEASA